MWMITEQTTNNSGSCATIRYTWTELLAVECCIKHKRRRVES